MAIKSGVTPFGSAAPRFAFAADELPGRVQQPAARGEEQRGHAARRRQLLALRRHPASDDADAVRAAAGARRTRRRPGAHACPRFDRCAAGQEEADQLGVVLADGPHEGRVTESRAPWR